MRRKKSFTLASNLRAHESTNLDFIIASLNSSGRLAFFIQLILVYKLPFHIYENIMDSTDLCTISYMWLNLPLTELSFYDIIMRAIPFQSIFDIISKIKRLHGLQFILAQSSTGAHSLYKCEKWNSPDLKQNFIQRAVNQTLVYDINTRLVFNSNNIIFPFIRPMPFLEFRKTN